MKRKALKKRGEEGTWALLKTSWRYHTKQFFTHSTLHGVRYIAEEDRPFGERFIWFCLTLIGTMLTLIIIASLWDKFQTNPTITGLDTDFHNWEVPFPTISLCPEDPTNDTLIADYISSTWGNGTNTQYYEEFLKTIAVLNIDNLPRILNFTENAEKFNLPAGNFHYALFKVVNMCPEELFDCEWKGLPYNCCEGFTAILTEAGFCFTFNSRFSKATNKNLRNVEAEFKPHLVYETDFKLSIVIKMRRSRVRVYIHTADEVPNRDLAPQHLWTKTINRILFNPRHTYTTAQVQQLTIKQRHCIFPKEIPMLYGVNYTYTGCITDCRIRRASSLCHCLPYFYQELDGFPPCDLRGLRCIARHHKQLLEVTCSCELGCMNTVYELEKLTEAGTDQGNNALEIGFVTWPMIRFKREVLFGWVDLLVSFGGIAGLFLGFSLLSGVEIIYYFTMRSLCMLHRNRDELKKLKQEYDMQPQPEINLDLKPSFMRKSRTQTSKIHGKKIPHTFNVPYLD